MAKTNPVPQRPLDRVDRRILRVLQEDGRISFTDLAARVGLSTSPCLGRVRRLEREGYIRGYNARLDPQRLGARLVVFVELKLNYDAADVLRQFTDTVLGFAEVQECHLVSGDYDYLLKIRVADMAAYREVWGRIIKSLPGIVRDSRSLVVMEEGKETVAVNLPG